MQLSILLLVILIPVLILIQGILTYIMCKNLAIHIVRTERRVMLLSTALLTALQASKANQEAYMQQQGQQETDWDDWGGGSSGGSDGSGELN